MCGSLSRDLCGWISPSIALQPFIHPSHPSHSHPHFSQLHSASAPAGASSAVVRVLQEGIKKPARDDRQYRMIWLKNGMQVLLTSDPTTDVASASMNIHAGHFQDPEEFAGLAHFHEHM